MKPEATEYVRYRMARAEETLRDAELLIRNGSLHGAVNRLYYACFYAVSALLLCRGLSSSKHSGVRSLFLRHWVKPGTLPEETGRFFNRLFEHRQKSDYKDLVDFAHQDVEGWFGQATDFVARIAEEVAKCSACEEQNS